MKRVQIKKVYFSRFKGKDLSEWENSQISKYGKLRIIKHIQIHAYAWMCIYFIILYIFTPMNIFHVHEGAKISCKFAYGLGNLVIKWFAVHIHSFRHSCFRVYYSTNAEILLQSWPKFPFTSLYILFLGWVARVEWP